MIEPFDDDDGTKQFDANGPLECKDEWEVDSEHVLGIKDLGDVHEETLSIGESNHVILAMSFTDSQSSAIHKTIQYLRGLENTDEFDSVAVDGMQFGISHVRSELIFALDMLTGQRLDLI